MTYGQEWTAQALKEAKAFLSRPAEKSLIQRTQQRATNSKYDRTDMHCPRRAGMTPGGLAAKVWRECCTAAWLHRTGLERIHPPSVESEEEEHDETPGATFFDSNEDPIEPNVPSTRNLSIQNVAVSPPARRRKRQSARTLSIQESSDASEDSGQDECSSSRGSSSRGRRSVQTRGRKRQKR